MKVVKPEWNLKAGGTVYPRQVDSYIRQAMTAEGGHRLFGLFIWPE